ncbi:MAG: transglycosylase SLT domain-containing protein [Nanoarchaeota archaeon]
MATLLYETFFCPVIYAESNKKRQLIPDINVAHLPLQNVGLPAKSIDFSDLSYSLKRAEHFREYIAEASIKHGVPQSLIKAVMYFESRMINRLSNRGAGGLMGLMPGTAKHLGLAVTEEFDQRFMPEYNIPAGTRYLRECINEFNGDTLLGIVAYHAGPSRLKKLVNIHGASWQAVASYIPTDTRSYCKNVLYLNNLLKGAL